MTPQRTIALTPEEAQQMQDLWNANPVLRMMGVQLDLSDPQCVQALIDPVLPQHRGGLGTQAVNGAVISGIFDLIIGLVGIVNSDKYPTATVQLNISFVRPLLGDQLIARGYLVKSGRALVYAQSEILDGDGNVCATCHGISSVDRTKPPRDNFMAIAI